MHALGQIIHKGLLDVNHHSNDLLRRTDAGACSSRGGNKTFSTVHEELDVKFVGEIVELETDGTRG